MELATLLDRYATGHEAVLAALAGLDERDLDCREAPGEWTIRQIVHHLADAEVNAYVRLRNLLTDIEYVVVPFDQDVWATEPRLGYDRPIESSLATLSALRVGSLELLRRLQPSDLERAGVHPEHPRPYTVGLWLELVAAHPHDHAEQIRRARATLGRS